jgi:hypothetical protein
MAVCSSFPFIERLTATVVIEAVRSGLIEESEGSPASRWGGSRT